MKRAALFLLGAIAVLAASGRGSELTERIRAEAQRGAEALLRGDYALLIDMTHPRIVAEMGGREAAIAAVVRSIAQMKTDGVTFESVETEAPSEPVSNDAHVAMLVPQKKILRTPQGRYRTVGHLLAISEDGGKTWHFIDSSSLSAATLAEYFPPLAGRITLPASPGLEKLEDQP